MPSSGQLFNIPFKSNEVMWLAGDSWWLFFGFGILHKDDRCGDLLLPLFRRWSSVASLSNEEGSLLDSDFIALEHSSLLLQHHDREDISPNKLGQDECSKRHRGRVTKRTTATPGRHESLTMILIQGPLEAEILQNRQML